MIRLAVGEIAALLGASQTGPGDPTAPVTFVTADSRQVEPGALFVALPGTRVDGHSFVPGAYAAGAVAALTREAVPGAPCLVVADPLVALGRLGRALIDRGRAGGLQVVGITGSQGKTSTKDLLSQVLEVAGPTVAPVGNLNNELGVPLTVCRIEPGTRFLVAEMGARGIGHIAYLCDIAPPRVGVVLNVGSGARGGVRREARHRPGQGGAGRSAAGNRRGGAERGRPARLGHAAADRRRGPRFRGRPAATGTRCLVQRRHR